MTFARSSLVALGLVGAFALGLVIGPQVSAARSPEPAKVEAPAPAPAPADAPGTVSKPSAARAASARLTRVPPVSAEPVKQQVKSLLNRGTDVDKAAAGFPNAYDLMTVAYASKNTAIPFVVLKHRVLSGRKPLAAAIGEIKPELNAEAEAQRARAEARADLARMSTQARSS
jgi:hypothetical protein